MRDSVTPRFPVQYASFTVAGIHLAVEVLEVQEVLCDQRLRPVPLAPGEVAGLINLRGQIVPALEMRRILHLPARERSADSVSIVVRSEHGPVSLQVDDIEDVVELDGSTFELPTSNVDANVRKVLRGVHKLKDKLLLVLDTSRTVQLGGA